MDRPDIVTVLICAHGQAELTFRCVQAVAEANDLALSEVILVDDASPDPLPGSGWPVPRLRVIRFAYRKGFLAAANAGAAAAKNPFIFFLNNDAEPRPGFLSYAVDLAKRYPHAAFIASKIIFPDGRLQEAGSTLRADGTAFNRGYGEEPEDFRYSFVCPVAYGSGAALLVRRSAFEELHGFDPAFSPAYYEDVDLQLRARARGWRTMYQPLSMVVHQRGASYGKGQGSTAEQLISRHRKLLCARHRPVQETALARPRLYYFDTLFPRRNHNGGAQRCFELLLLLQERFQVTFIPMTEAGTQADVTALTQAGIRVAQNRDAVRPIPALRFLQMTQAERPACCVLARPDGAARVLDPIRRMHPQCRLVYDTVDLAFARYESFLAQPRSPGTDAEMDALLYQKFHALETYLMHVTDRVWVVADDERSLLVEKGMCQADKVAVIPLVYPPRPTPAAWKDRTDLLFWGNYAHRPNVDSLHNFVRTILPLWKRKGWSLRLKVAGPNTEMLNLAPHERIDVCGHVSDLDPVMNQARLAFFPLINGAGMKSKVAHALAAGLPVVTTSYGAQGYPRAEECMAVADTAEEIVEAIGEVYHHPPTWERMRAAGLRYAAEQTSRDAMRKRLDREFSEPI